MKLFIVLTGVLFSFLEPILGASNHSDLIHRIPPPPKPLYGRELYNWNRDHYFALAEQIRKKRRVAEKSWKTKVAPIFDYSSFVGKTPQILEKEICQRPYQPTHVNSHGTPIKMLGGAFVYMGPSNGRSLFGHVGERYLYCYGERLADVLYEYEPMDSQLIQTEEDLLGKKFAEDYKSGLLKSNYLNLTFNPTEKYYAEQQFFRNRNIYEAWFNVEENILFELLGKNADRFAEQRSKLQNLEPLPEYKLLKEDCTTEVEEDLGVLNPYFLESHKLAHLTPSLLYKYASQFRIEKILIYPSQRLFRILKEKSEGHSTFREYFAPFSKASKGAKKGWVLIFPDHDSRLKHIMVSPLAGTVNLGVALVETIWGIVSTPLKWLSNIPGLDFLNFKSGGPKRISSGFFDIFSSVTEIFGFRIRYPTSSSWTEEEKSFFTDLEQNSLLLEYLRLKHQGAPLVVLDSQ